MKTKTYAKHYEYAGLHDRRSKMSMIPWRVRMHAPPTWHIHRIPAPPKIPQQLPLPQLQPTRILLYNVPTWWPTDIALEMQIRTIGCSQRCLKNLRCKSGTKAFFCVIHEYIGVTTAERCLLCLCCSRAGGCPWVGYARHDPSCTQKPWV